MIPDERLTAYALNELDAPERAEVEQWLGAHPEAQATVEATRALAARLTAGLAAEAMPAMVAVKPKRSRTPMVAALAASLLLAVGLGVNAWTDSQAVRPQQDVALANNDVGLNSQLDQTVKPEGFAVEDAQAKQLSDPAKVAANFNRTPSSGVQNAGGISLPQPAMPSLSKPIDSADPLSVAGRGSDPKPTALPSPTAASAAAVIAPHTRRPALGEGIPDPADPASRFSKEKADSFGGNFAFEPGGYDRYPALVENDFVKVEGQAALSTFGVDVDTASYSIMRKYLSQNQLPPAGAVRLEEMVNYFPYRDAAPKGDDPFAVTVEMAECPWQPKHRLARIGLKAKPIDYKNRPASNLVFLIDVSGSMNEPNKLPLVKASLKMLVNELGENDSVAMVVYAGASGVVLDSTSAARKPEILDALDRLQAGGSTNGASGIALAYDVALAHFIEGGTNRVVLCTDGDWNVGTTSTDELIKLIESKRKTNVFLSVFGFGMGNLRDEMMVNLAGKGNGNYGYIDSLKEARKAFVEQIGGTLITVAKDVKIQVEFNPVKVGAYRLLGYEKRKLAAEDFHNDAKDAGEMGAGHVVTALYELAPAGSTVAAGVDGLKYQAGGKVKGAATEAFTVKLRHKRPTSDVSDLREIAVADSNKPYGEASEDFRFAAAVASYAMLLRESPHKGNATYGMVMELANAAKGWDPGGYRAEFVKLAAKARTVAGKP